MRKIGVLLLPLFAIACGSDQSFGDQAPIYPPSLYVPLEPVQQVDRVLQVTTPQVDILWTIDNSCSMANEQDKLADNFPVFIGYFVGSGLDYHIGVTSTDIDNPNRNGADGKLVSKSGMTFIDTRTPNPEFVFEEMAKLGIDGSWNEKGLGATYKALEEKRDTANAGFYRDDASIHTVVISDERDQTPGSLITEQEFKGWYDGLKQNNDDRTFSAIVNLGGSERGTAYLNTAAEIGGITWDITAEDWSLVLDRLGIQASGLKREYFLSQRPVPGTVDVWVMYPSGAERRFFETQLDPETGEPLTADDVESLYTYDSTRNSITFLTFIPEALSTIQIEYTLQSAAQVQEGI